MILEKAKTINETPEQKSKRLAKLSSNESVTAMASAAGGGIQLRDTVTLSVNSKGYCVLSYSASVCGDDDFVGIYKNASLPQEDSLAWEWCSRVSNFPYTTSVEAQVGLVAIYWSKDYRTGQYVRVCYTAGLSNTNSGAYVQGSST